LSIGTDINSKVSGTSNLISAIINNTANGWQQIALEVTLGSITTAAGAGFGLYLLNSIDGTTFGDPVLAGAYGGINNVGVSAGTGAKGGEIILAISPFYTRLLFVNNLGVTTAASGNQIRYQFFGDRSIA
jgi:hypothetical protein